MKTTWVDWGGMTAASDGGQRTAPGGFRHQGPDAPSAWLSLVGLRPRSARLRFTRHPQSSLGSQPCVDIMLYTDFDVFVL